MSREMCEHWNIPQTCKECSDIEDIILWPCGEWCYRYELEEMTHKSDDYQIIKYGTEEHEEITMG